MYSEMSRKVKRKVKSIQSLKEDVQAKRFREQRLAFETGYKRHVVKQGDFRHEKKSRTHNVLAMLDRVNIYEIEILMNIHN
jgi:hypothetical protein